MTIGNLKHIYPSGGGNSPVLRYERTLGADGVIKKRQDGKWEVNIKPGGRTGRQFRRTFGTRTEAAQYQAWVVANATPDPQWKPEKADTRRLSELIEIWYEAHGKQLSAAADTKRRLDAIAAALNNPNVDRIGAAMFATYRTARIAADITPATMNRELAYVRAMFNTLSELGHWTKPNPVEKVRAFRVQEAELAWLDFQRIEKLLEECGKSRNKHVRLITTTCLQTGARWSEIEELKISQVKDDHLHLHHTKSKKVRNVPIEEDLARQLREHHREHGSDGRIFEYAWGAFREAVERAGIDLPEGQMAHVLRHSFASHFIAGGGNIVALQRLLGHSDLKTTMRYAHLAPDHLADARALNPIRQLANASDAAGIGGA